MHSRLPQFIPLLCNAYLIVNDGIGGFNPATDLVINLTGYSSTLPRVGNIGVSNLSLFV
ncbi:bluetail domain-containing putative surface protein [Cylindrospermopsis raciborskii]|uniref:bluetail domain-containing putative surface protein n=1 Tax=Cylindrospermopsis raciborskii TaxID=77022 RepID=UPI003DA1FC39